MRPFLGGIPLDLPFVRRTYVSATVLATFVVLLLWSYSHVWAIGPLCVGFLLALGLLYVSERVVPGIFRAGGGFVPRPTGDAEKKKKEIAPRLRRLLPIVLVKYLSVGLVAFFAARHWQTSQLIAFCGGFLLVQANITMRAIGRALSSTRSGSNANRPFVSDLRSGTPAARATASSATAASAVRLETKR